MKEEREREIEAGIERVRDRERKRQRERVSTNETKQLPVSKFRCSKITNLIIKLTIQLRHELVLFN